MKTIGRLTAAFTISLLAMLAEQASFATANTREETGARNSIAITNNIATANSGSSESGMSGSSETQEDLSKVNGVFRASYQEAKREIREKLGPVIILTGDEAILLRNGNRSSAKLIPAEYTLDKVVDHIPLAIFVSLTNRTGKPLDQASKQSLEQLRDLAVKAEPAVDAGGLNTTDLARQHQIIERSVAFIKETLESSQVSAATLQAFTRGVSKLTLANADEAMAAALKRMDDVVQGWHKEMTSSEWDELHVIVISGHMPRIQNSSMQYFLKLLHQKQEGDRVIYFEGNGDEKQALDLLVTHLLDKRIAIGFYKDPWRMHRDFLSDSAHKYLKKHSPSVK